jgi:hypothetical protein
MYAYAGGDPVNGSDPTGLIHSRKEPDKSAICINGGCTDIDDETVVKGTRIKGLSGAEKTNLLNFLRGGIGLGANTVGETAGGPGGGRGSARPSCTKPNGGPIKDCIVVIGNRIDQERRRNAQAIQFILGALWDDMIRTHVEACAVIQQKSIEACVRELEQTFGPAVEAFRRTDKYALAGRAFQISDAVMIFNFSVAVGIELGSRTGGIPLNKLKFARGAARKITLPLAAAGYTARGVGVFLNVGYRCGG